MRSTAPTAFRDHYAILGVRVDAGEAEIKAAYREQAKRCHPDLHPGDEEAAERFREISEARRVLLSPAARAAFNLDRKEWQLRVEIVSVMNFRRPRPEAAANGPAAPAVPTPRPSWHGGALMVAGVLTVLLSVTALPFVTLAGGPQAVAITGFDGGALAGVLNSGASSVMVVLGWAAWLGYGGRRRWEALFAFTALWLLAVTAAEFDPHLLVGGYFASDLGLAIGARLLPVGVSLTVCGAWLLRPPALPRAALQPVGVAPETA